MLTARLAGPAACPYRLYRTVTRGRNRSVVPVFLAASLGTLADSAPLRAAVRAARRGGPRTGTRRLCATPTRPRGCARDRRPRRRSTIASQRNDRTVTPGPTASQLTHSRCRSEPATRGGMSSPEMSADQPYAVAIEEQPVLGRTRGRSRRQVPGRPRHPRFLRARPADCLEVPPLAG